jgi:cellulose synthase (UDP-forming)
MSIHFSVDVFVTAYNEEYSLIERCLQAACQMRGEHRTWLLDDGNHPELAQMAKRLNAGYLTRTERTNAKAGNINAALNRTSGEIVVIFDIDHVPEPDFLEQTLHFFDNPRIGFVQVMLTFSNAHESWIARAAIESSRDFYSATSVGADAIRGATLVGSNALIRRKALESIGGYQPGLAEDLATSMALHAADWGSVYVRKPLAPGLAPPDLPAWFAQQLKWSRGVFELLLTAYPRYFSALALGQKVSYAVRMTYYWLGLIIFLHLMATTLALYLRSESFLAGFEEYLFYLLPLAVMTWLIRTLAFWQWRHPSEQVTSQWRAVLLVYATWPIYTLAWFMAVFRLPLAFRPTPKQVGGPLSPLWLAPQFIALLLLLIGITLDWQQMQQHPVVVSFGVAQIFPQLWLLISWLRSSFQPVIYHFYRHRMHPWLNLYTSRQDESDSKRNIVS